MGVPQNEAPDERDTIWIPMAGQTRAQTSLTVLINVLEPSALRCDMELCRASFLTNLDLSARKNPFRTPGAGLMKGWVGCSASSTDWMKLYTPCSLSSL